MVELTPEEKQKIYEEEKEKEKAKEKIKQEKTKKGCMGCLIVFLVIIVISIVLSIFSPILKNTPIKTTPPPTEQIQPKLILQEWSIDCGDETYIIGIVKNDSSKECRYVQISFNLYDKNNYQIGTAIANTNNLEPYGKWKFKTLSFDPVATNTFWKAKFKDLTGF